MKYYRIHGAVNDLTNDDDDFKYLAKLLAIEALTHNFTEKDLGRNLVVILMSMMAMGFTMAYQAAIEAGVNETEINRILNEYDGGNNEQTI